MGKVIYSVFRLCRKLWLIGMELVDSRKVVFCVRNILVSVMIKGGIFSVWIVSFISVLNVVESVKVSVKVSVGCMFVWISIVISIEVKVMIEFIDRLILFEMMIKVMFIVVMFRKVLLVRRLFVMCYDSMLGNCVMYSV